MLRRTRLKRSNRCRSQEIGQVHSDHISKRQSIQPRCKKGQYPVPKLQLPGRQTTNSVFDIELLLDGKISSWQDAPISVKTVRLFFET